MDITIKIDTWTASMLKKHAFLKYAEEKGLDLSKGYCAKNLSWNVIPPVPIPDGPSDPTIVITGEARTGE
jgi:hypothetical protein